MVDEKILRDAAQELRVVIHAAKVTSLKTQIAENSDRMSLYMIVDTFLLKKPIHKLPSHDCVLELAGRFSLLFTKKISDIR